ncbi:MAG: xanthine dehydrogenase family protein molybdopterin-binding subunit [Halobacteriota archaeon]
MSKNPTPEEVAERRHVPPASDRGERFKVIGQNMDRKEDPRLMTGHGTYVDDVELPNMAEAAVLRSPHAHARIVDIDTSRAEALDGVDYVLTGQKMAEQTSTGPLPTFSSPPTEQYCLAVDRVRHVGEYVAAVVAEDRYVAEDALDLLDVEYERLPTVIDAHEAVDSEGDAVIHPERDDGFPGNIMHQQHFTFGEPDEAFEEADVVVERTLDWPRSSGQPMETAGAIADYNPGENKFDIHANTSMYNYVGWLVANSLNVPSNKLNIIPTLAGGSFGSKLFAHKVCVLAGTLAREVGRPVKFVEDRFDNMLSNDNHGCDRYYEPAELALDADGNMLGFRCEVLDDYGAYFQFEAGHHGNAMAQITGPYTIESVDYNLTAVATNKNQQGAYRGFGSEVQNWVLERLVDAAAEELDMDPVDIRRQNFIPPEEFPYKIPSGNMYDSGNYEAVLDRALEMLDYEGWREKQAEAREEGRHVGIGVATCQERSVFSSTEFWFWNDDPDFPLTSSPESVEISIDQTGKAKITLHSPFWGNSPETVATQVLAEEFTIDPDDISIEYADMDHGLDGTGPGGSRYTVMVAGAIQGGASEIKEKMKKIAANALETSADDLELEAGEFRVRGAPERSIGFGDVALQAHMFELDLPEDVGSGLSTDYTYDHPFTTKPADDRSDLGVFYPIMGHMCHMAVVEVDVDTGHVDFLDYVAVHDCGTVVNPKTLDGHIRGGTAQGIATTLYEEHIYDENGQALTGSFMDYLIPTAHEVPAEIKTDHVETPSPWTEYGIKGGGEGGRMGAPPAVSRAVEDALEPYGIEVDSLPLMPGRLQDMIREARGDE